MVEGIGANLLTVDEAAALLRVHRMTLYRWRQAGKGPRYTRVGRFIMYTQESVAEFLRSNSVSHETEGVKS